MKDSKSVVGIDIAKRVFQVHNIDRETGEIVILQLKRERFLEHFANRQPCLIGMEVCGGAHPWARKLTALGHQVKLMPAKAVKPFLTGNKNDRHDARAIWTAVQQPHVKAVAIKTEEQQAILAGKQPRCMSLLWFQRNPLPTDWAAQREMVAPFDA
jgi:transposase